MSGRKLRTNNDRIVEYLQTLKSQRDEIQAMILKLQEEQKAAIQDLERLKYKLLQIDKSLVQRLAARDQYDRSIKEADENYRRIVDCSGILLCSVQKEYGVLSEAIDKRVGTAASDDQENDNTEPKTLNQVKPVKSSKSNTVIPSEFQMSSSRPDASVSGLRKSSQSTKSSTGTSRSTQGSSRTTQSTISSRNTSGSDNTQNMSGISTSQNTSGSETIEKTSEIRTTQNTNETCIPEKMYGSPTIPNTSATSTGVDHEASRITQETIESGTTGDASKLLSGVSVKETVTAENTKVANNPTQDFAATRKNKGKK